MQEAWIDLVCPECEQRWEANPADLPAPGSDYQCRHCGAERSVAEFVHTARGLEILESFHG